MYSLLLLFKMCERSQKKKIPPLSGVKLVQLHIVCNRLEQETGRRTVREMQSIQNAKMFKVVFVYHNSVYLPAHNNELTLCGLWSDASPDVHGEQSAAAVKDGGQRGHKSS